MSNVTSVTLDPVAPLAQKKGHLSPIARAEELFHQHFPELLFVEHLAKYLRYGFVFNSPSLFVMWRHVRRDAGLIVIATPALTFADPDAVYVDLAVGNLSELAATLPWPDLPWTCFNRKFGDRLKFYPTAPLLRRCLLS